MSNPFRRGMIDPLANPEEVLPRLYAYVAYRLGDGPNAEDVTSETVERALRYRDRYDSTKGEPLAWLIGIARNCIADARRPESVPLSALPASQQPIEDDLAESAARRVELRAAVARLDGREQDLVALRYGADLTARQVGEVLGMRTNAVEVALHRALRRLRTYLDDAGTSALERDLDDAVRVSTVRPV